MDAPVIISARGDPATGGRNVPQGRGRALDAPCPASSLCRSDPKPIWLMQAAPLASSSCSRAAASSSSTCSTRVRNLSQPARYRTPVRTGAGGTFRGAPGAGPTGQQGRERQRLQQCGSGGHECRRRVSHCRAQGAAATTRGRLAWGPRQRPAGGSIAVTRSVGVPPAAAAWPQGLSAVAFLAQGCRRWDGLSPSG